MYVILKAISIVEEEQQLYPVVVLKVGKNNFTQIDLDDYDTIKNRIGKICINSYGYALGYDRNNDMRLVLIHRLILEDRLTQDINEIDHKNNNPLDNRRTNLRLCTHQENLRNIKKRSNCSSFYKGVHKKDEKWISRYALNNKRYYIGCYESEEDAARAYDDKIRDIFKEFAKFNFPREGEQSAI